MPLDAICLSGVLTELRPQILGARVDKVQQPERDKVILTLRGKDTGGKLLLASGTGSARLHLTSRSYENPQSPPMFCMLLRKHLAGAKLREVTQPPMERLVKLIFDTYNELGEPSQKTLILELLGKYCNLILVDEEGIILDAQRRIDADHADRRILPGLRWHEPEAQGKMSPFEVTYEAFRIALAGKAGDQRLDSWILDTLRGISPLIARELTHRSFGKTDARLEETSAEQREAFLSALTAFFSEIQKGNLTPYELRGEDGPVDFSYTPITQYGRARQNIQRERFGILLDNFYETRDRLDRHRQQAGALVKSVTNLRDRSARKLELQKEELAQAEDRERYREQGDIITANLHMLTRGQESLTALNFYDPSGGEITITLDPLKTPQQNAAAYYKRYNKAKTAERHLIEQMDRAKGEREYLDSVLESLEKAETTSDIAQIRQELTEAGLLKQSAGKKQKLPPAKPLAFVSSTGMPIYAGKNNLQNDQLTFKTANRLDIWLHTKDLHGSHVIIATGGAEPDAETLEEAATIAAWYSEGKAGTKIPVDYTLVKHVKKPSGAKPGATHYVNFKTIYVDPDETLVNRLRKGN